MSVHIIDSALFGHLWTTPEMTEWFCDQGRLRVWIDILVALAQAQAEIGLIPADAARSIRQHVHSEQLDISQVAAETRSTGHSTLGLIRCLRDILPEHAREWIYYGATVQDLTDTWTALTFAHVGEMLDRDLRRIEKAALHLAEEHRAAIMCGRTHGQPGLPITFGYKAAVWADELHRHRARLADGRRRWNVVQLGGALGTMEFWGDQALELLSSFAARLDLGTPDIPWLTARDRVAEFATLLAFVTGTLAKIGNEIYELQRPEIGEVREPFRMGQVGSITMPHKRNPELSEQLDTLARVVRSDAGLAIEGLVALHERDGRSWKAEWEFLPEASAMTAAALRIGAELLEGLEVDSDRMAANLAARHGYVMSEPVMRALADRFGKHTAHEIVYRAAMQGVDDGLDLREALLADQSVAQELSPEALDGLLDPRRALGATEAFIDRVLSRAGSR